VKNECVSRQVNIRCERIRLLLPGCGWTRMSGFIRRGEFLLSFPVGYFLDSVFHLRECVKKRQEEEEKENNIK
jgi:hypothetical protein